MVSLRAIALVSAVAVASVGCARGREAVGGEGFCPTLPAETRDAVLVHGARVLDGETTRGPVDVLMANGEIVAVGAALCFRAVGGSVELIDGAGRTLEPVEAGETIAPGRPGRLRLVDGAGKSEIVRRSRP